jgi:hypothetical protein
MSDALDALLKHCADNNRVCPMPGQWNTLGDMMIDLDPSKAAFNKMRPLILAGWWASSDQEKARRLADQLKWFDQHGALHKADAHLRGLLEGQWHHADDRLA